jgi:hypothetical protein
MFQWVLGSQWLFIFWSDPASLIIFKVMSFIKKVDIWSSFIFDFY